MTGFTVKCASDDGFAGTVKVFSTTDDKNSCDETVPFSGGPLGTMTLDGTRSTNGGQAGDTLYIVAINSNYWLVTGTLTNDQSASGLLAIFS